MLTGIARKTLKRMPSSQSSHGAFSMALRCCVQFGALMSSLLLRLEYVQQIVLITLVFHHALCLVVCSDAWGRLITPNMTSDTVNA